MTVDTFACPLTGGAVVDGKLLFPGPTLQTISYSDQLELAATFERAKSGNAEAMYAIGNWYISGCKGLARSPSDAHWWWERACEYQPTSNLDDGDELDDDWTAEMWTFQ